MRRRSYWRGWRSFIPGEGGKFDFHGFCYAYVLVFTPFAVAGDEWINGDQKGELFEALAEFSHCRRSSFRQRVPA